MLTINCSSIPAVNKNGESKLTFIGLEIKEGKAGEVNTRGKVYDEDWKIQLAVFKTKSLNRQSIEIKVIRNPTLDTDDLLYKLLVTFDFPFPEVQTEEDEDGLQIEAMEEDEDGLCFQNSNSEGKFIEEIEKFLENVKGTIFWGKLTSSKQKGFTRYFLEPDSLRAYQK